MIEDVDEFGIRCLWFEKLTGTWWPDIEGWNNRYKL